MKIYRRPAFMALPEGIIFAKGKPWYFGDVCVKGETLVHDGKAIDFCHRTLVWIDANDSGEAADRLDAMLELGASYPLEQAEGRDGCFDEEDLFLVYESADLRAFADVVARATEIVDQLAKPADP